MYFSTLWVLLHLLLSASSVSHFSSMAQICQKYVLPAHVLPGKQMMSYLTESGTGAVADSRSDSTLEYS